MIESIAAPSPTFQYTPLRDPVPCPGHGDLEALGERIAELSAQITAATYQLLVLILEFDQREGWGDGIAPHCFRNCAHWLSWRTGLALGPAREKVRVARALGELPLISEAMRCGELSYSKVRALTRIATPESEGDLLSFARAGTASHVERLVRAWRTVDRQQAAEQEALRHASRHLDTYTDEDGMVVVRARLEPEAGAALVKALDAASAVLYGETGKSGREVSVAERRADAMGRVAEAALAGGLDRGSRGDRFQVIVHVDAEVLAEEEAPEGCGGQGMSLLEDGGNVPAGTSRRIACDASTVVMTHDKHGRTLDVGRKTRVISPGLRRVLDHRDGGCRFPGCGLRFCDAHHVKHWADGGETKLDNLILLCRRHHRCVHEGGYDVERDASGEFRFLRPDGREMPQAPELPAVADDALTELADRLTEAGVEIDPVAIYPQWDGSRLDLHWAIAVMWQ